MQNGGTNNTTPFHIYKCEVAKASGLTVSALNLGALYRAYDMGEPVWMAADEMKLRAECKMPSVKPHQLPSIAKVCVLRIKS